MKNFWEKLPKPLFALAPLANVTDVAFRSLIAKYSKPYGPSVCFTEFVSADGLFLGNRDVLMNDLRFSEVERPIVAQFFTGSPEMMEKAAALAHELGFDGVDINMGCPDRAVERGGAGAALMKNPTLAKELIEAAKQGAGGLPISVKTRLGYNKDILEDWLPLLLEADLAAIIIHARTRKEMSKVPAQWDRVKRAVEIRNEKKAKTLIVGNGDVVDLDDARRKVEESGADGAMLGRAIFGKPWLWNPKANYSAIDRLNIAVEHTKLFSELLGEVKNFAIMKKHFKAYAEGFPGAKELRMKLMDTSSAAEVEEVIRNFTAGQHKIKLPSYT